jgi:hypothetical protein
MVLEMHPEVVLEPPFKLMPVFTMSMANNAPKLWRRGSSNCWEWNLVEALKGLVVEHDMRGSKMFIFTDNSTAEAAFWKG